MVFCATIASVLASDFIYTEEVEKKSSIPKEIYKEVVNNLPISCVDVFLYDRTRKAYLLVLRKQAPAKNVWWMPGGRIFKGETFLESAARKCHEEIGLKIIPLRQLGTFTTIFPDSAWDCQTHTINTVILAEVADSNSAILDQNHTDYQWRSLDTPPEDPYVREAYRQALNHLKSQNE
jgi:colanic acid biosynthesis protein WcaH